MEQVNQIIMKHLSEENFSVEVLCRKLSMNRPVLSEK